MVKTLIHIGSGILSGAILALLAGVVMTLIQPEPGGLYGSFNPLIYFVFLVPAGLLLGGFIGSVSAILKAKSVVGGVLSGLFGTILAMAAITILILIYSLGAVRTYDGNQLFQAIGNVFYGFGMGTVYFCIPGLMIGLATTAAVRFFYKLFDIESEPPEMENLKIT